MPVDPLQADEVTEALRAALPYREGRITLRPLAPADLDVFRAYQTDPGTLKYLYRPALSEDTMRERCAAGLVPVTGDGHSVALAVEVDSEFVGETVIKLTDLAGRQVEIGWILSPSARGRGIATEAARATLHLALNVVRAHRVFAHLDAENLGSARVAEKIGMREEARMIDDAVNPATGEYGSSSYWAILESEAPARPS